MILFIKSTPVVTVLDGVQVRMCEAETSNGTPIQVFVHRIAAASRDNCEELERELSAQLPPAELVDLKAIPFFGGEDGCC